MPFTKRTHLLTNTSSGASSIMTTTGAQNYSMVVTSTGVTTGAVVTLQGTADGTNYYDITSTSVSANETTCTSITNECHFNVRANIKSTDYTDGSYEVYLLYTTGGK